MAKYLDYDGVKYLWGKIKTTFALISHTHTKSQITDFPTIPSANSTATNIKMDGTQSAGSLATFAKADHVHPSDTSRVPTTRKVNDKALSADITLDGEDIIVGGNSQYASDDIATVIETLDGAVDNKVDKVSGKGLSTNDYTTAEKSKLEGIAAGAEVNVNADWNATSGDAQILNKPTIPTLKNVFGIVKVGSTSITADTTQDTLTLGAGDAIVLTPDATNDSVTFGLADEYGDTKNPYGSKAKNLILASPTGTAGLPTFRALYPADIPDLNASKITAGTLSADRIPTSIARKASPEFTGTPTAPTAAAGTDTTQIATTAFVKTAVENAMAGGAVFKGTAPTNFAPTNYTAGWYWIVGTAGTYAGETCEAGDMIFCTTSAATYAAANFDVIQTNLTTLTTSDIDAAIAAA